MLTVTALARNCGLSRSTVLYYETSGLLRPARRSTGNYRVYGQAELERLQEICRYREAGLTLSDIRTLLTIPTSGAVDVLQRRFTAIGQQVNKLQAHQREIARLLRGAGQKLRRNKMITKDKWVAVMKAAGFDENDMKRWHGEFEKAAPEEHQEFLDFLHIPADEAAQIREWSRTEA
jgi:MerR family transcriptional regulator, thiopeptide resistance regulator